MNDQVKHKTLLLLQHKGSITELIKEGYTYGQIAGFINQLAEEELIKDENGTLVLAKAAESWLDEQKKTTKPSGAERWILPEEKSRISRIDVNEVYLPSRNELHF